MDYFERTYSNLIKNLYNKNLYFNLLNEEKDEIEYQLQKMVSELSQHFEKQIGDNKYCGVKLKFSDEVKFSINSFLLKNEKYRGQIICTRLIIIAMYEMFYSMNYERIIVDGKNVEIIKKLLFMYALNYMIWHELAHIYKGHLQLLDRWEKEGSREKHKLDIQTLEWDADSFSATKAAELINGLKSNILRNDKTDFVTKIMCGSIHGLMYWQRTKEDFENIERKEHPPNLFREVAMLSSISDLLGNRNAIIRYVMGYEEEFNKVLNISNVNVVQYFNEAVKKDDYTSNILAKRWVELKKELEPYSAFPLDDIDNLQNLK